MSHLLAAREMPVDSTAVKERDKWSKEHHKSESLNTNILRWHGLVVTLLHVLLKHLPNYNIILDMVPAAWHLRHGMWCQCLHYCKARANDCRNCQLPMSLVRRAEAPEGYSWKCRDCQTRTSVCTGSFSPTASSAQKQSLWWCITGSMRSNANVMLFEGIVSWDTIVNYNNYFRLECRNWLLNQQVQLGGLDINGQPTDIRRSGRDVLLSP